jgi:glutamyl-tRNA synthetase
LIQGETKLLLPSEDFILLRFNGSPTPHFENVVDDYLMKISHVIRGDEWLKATS